jgi:hypothetical protein
VSSCPSVIVCRAPQGGRPVGPLVRVKKRPRRETRRGQRGFQIAGAHPCYPPKSLAMNLVPFIETECPARQRTMPTRRHRRDIKPDRIRALELLASCDNGCPEGILHAHGFAISDMMELVDAGLATATAERVIAGSRKMEVARVRITAAGRRVLEKARR